MNKKLFIEALNIVKKNERDERRLDLILNTEGFINFTGRSNSIIVKLLKEMVNDNECDWIGFWCWECDFGKNAKGKVFIDDEPIDLSTPDKLYDMLTKDDKK